MRAVLKIMEYIIFEFYSIFLHWQQTTGTRIRKGP
jgi:hypothetical protein